ncbi:MAG: hypothetical protein A2951_02930 [Candidatus Buchananbacteria bacterium RIFCSPLOWO2_01_FULL_56_15]|uniref:Four helix bundle protein n=2 Tax=Candidatus Buchananiibacteriota TaxID=1817903 RepID=A0A1G1YGJ0_9BACT|nr:MAG: hypothetical protein A3J59_04535 [Candidatus Buchananbacteria bacterium RIFCSPHIGHO2_02_FULL_56_16]OGY54875.1 MAG: hypothetical protein A2951_02930 [Candidatus Buchananbacteria bacterium RIFCSPLOWO2_01_FULL_56_15]
MAQGYRDLIVWQKAIKLIVEIYKLSNTLPRAETYGLSSQMRRAAVSIPSNIAEGSRRGTHKEFRYFLLVAFGSGAELETQVEIAKQLYTRREINFETIDLLLDEVMKMLNKMIYSTDYRLLTTN